MGMLGDITDANEKEANSFLEILAKRDIYWKGKLSPKYDVLSEDRSGKELHYGPEQPMWRVVNNGSPIAVTDPVEDELKEALFTIRYDMPETLTTYKGEPLSAFEQSEMEKILATSTLRQDLLRVVRHPSFKASLRNYKKLGLKESDGYKLKDQIFTRAIRKVFSAHKARAIEKLIAQNQQLSTRLQARFMQKQMGQTGDFNNKQLVDYLLTSFPK